MELSLSEKNQKMQPFVVSALLKRMNRLVYFSLNRRSPPLVLVVYTVSNPSISLLYFTELRFSASKLLAGQKLNAARGCMLSIPGNECSTFPV